jgi:IS605 OrfB family transposase
MLSYNVKLNFPSKETEQAMLDCLKTEVDCYGYVSALLETTGFREHPMSRYDVHYKFYYDIRKQYPTLSSQMVCKVIQEVVASWKTCLQTKEKFNTPKKRNLSMTLDKRLYSKLTDHSVNITVPGFKKVQCTFDTYPLIQYMFDNYNAKNCNMFYRDNQFWLTVQFETPELSVVNEDVLGIDRGIKRLITCSDGTAISDKDFNKRRRQIRYLKRCLASKRTKNANRHLKKLHRKEARMSKDYTYRVANYILSKPEGIIVLEDLTKIKKTTSRKKINNGSGENKEIKRKRHNNRFGQVALRQLQTVLEYKAPLVGKRVATVEPAYTSQLDCRGLPNGERLGTRYYAADGLVLDADWNASINIASRYHPSTFTMPIYGKLNLLGRPPSTGQSRELPGNRGSLKPTVL